MEIAREGEMAVCCFQFVCQFACQEDVKSSQQTCLSKTPELHFDSQADGYGLSVESCWLEAILSRGYECLFVQTITSLLSYAGILRHSCRVYGHLDDAYAFELLDVLLLKQCASFIREFRLRHGYWLWRFHTATHPVDFIGQSLRLTSRNSIDARRCLRLWGSLNGIGGDSALLGTDRTCANAYQGKCRETFPQHVRVALLLPEYGTLSH
jgi:hypothetical protein